MPTAFILLNTEIGVEREVLKKLRATDGVQKAFSLLGIYDIIARVKTDTTAEIRNWQSSLEINDNRFGELATKASQMPR